MSWTDERVELLKNLWAEGLSASQIAAQIGGISRNAVIGKVHRMKLSSRGRATPPAARPKKTQRPAVNNNRATARPSASRAPAVVGATALQTQFEPEAAVLPAIRAETDVVVPIARKLALTELTEKTCKWPIGDPLSEAFHFCGNQSSEAGPYCSYHARMAFQPASERRRK